MMPNHALAVALLAGIRLAVGPLVFGYDGLSPVLRRVIRTSLWIYGSHRSMGMNPPVAGSSHYE